MKARQIHMSSSAHTFKRGPCRAEVYLVISSDEGMELGVGSSYVFDKHNISFSQM